MALTLIIGIVNLVLGYALAVWLGYGPPVPALAGWTRGVPPAPPPSVPAVLPDQEPAGPPAEPAEPQPRSVDEKYVEASVLSLNKAMLRSEAKLTEIDSRLRAAGGNYDRETVAACRTELLVDCETYLVEQREAGERFHELSGELSECGPLAEQIELANLEQSAQVESTISTLRHTDFESDLTAAADRLLTEIEGLRAARHRLRGSLEVAFPAARAGSGHPER